MALLENRVARLEAEHALLRNRFIRVPGRRRPHYRRSGSMDTLWHAARYGLSIERTWRSMKQEYVRQLFLHHSIRTPDDAHPPHA